MVDSIRSIVLKKIGGNVSGSLHNYDGVHVRCNFAMYETVGILCHHVLKKKKVNELLKHYILSRWALSIKYMIHH